MSGFSMVEALNRALADELAEDDKVLVFGQDVAALGGVFRVTEGLHDRFGDRVFDTPLAESAIVGTAIGMAMYGYRPVVEMQFDGFSYPAFEQIVSHVAKMRNRSRGHISLPMVIRIPFGGGIGSVEHHSESPETYFAHTAGLTVVSPAAADDAYSLLRSSIRSDDPVVFLEPKSRYWHRHEGTLPVTTLNIGVAQVRRPGTTATLIGYGPTVEVCLAAAVAGSDEGWDLEVIDLRSLSPLDTSTLISSVEKTGRAIVVHEAGSFLGMGAEIASQLTEKAFYSLQAPVLRVTGFDIPYPSAQLEAYHLPGVDRVLDAVARSLSY